MCDECKRRNESQKTLNVYFKASYLFKLSEIANDLMHDTAVTKEAAALDLLEIVNGMSADIGGELAEVGEY